MKAVASVVAPVLVLGTCLGVLSAPAYAASPAVKIRVQPRIVNFRQPRYQSATKISGRLLNHKAGIHVVLEASRWPFQAGFRPVGKARTRKGGRFEFERRPSLATHYRVAVPGLGIQSRSRHVYVLPGLTPTSCSITGNGRHGGCRNFNAPAGIYTLRIAYDFLYPRSVAETESAKPVFFYFGQRDGSRSYPRVLALEDTTYPQLPSGTGSARVVISRSMALPGTDWAMFWVACTQTSAQADGFGLPGPPGSNGCGGPTTTVNRFFSGLPLG